MSQHLSALLLLLLTLGLGKASRDGASERAGALELDISKALTSSSINSSQRAVAVHTKATLDQSHRGPYDGKTQGGLNKPREGDGNSSSLGGFSSGEPGSSDASLDDGAVGAPEGGARVDVDAEQQSGGGSGDERDSVRAAAAASPDAEVGGEVGAGGSEDGSGSGKIHEAAGRVADAAEVGANAAARVADVAEVVADDAAASKETARKQGFFCKERDAPNHAEWNRQDGSNKADDADECQRRCEDKAEEGCRGFDYYPTSSRCWLFNHDCTPEPSSHPDTVHQMLKPPEAVPQVQQADEDSRPREEADGSHAATPEGDSHVVEVAKPQEDVAEELKRKNKEIEELKAQLSMKEGHQEAHAAVNTAAAAQPDAEDPRERMRNVLCDVSEAGETEDSLREMKHCIEQLEAIKKKTLDQGVKSWGENNNYVKQLAVLQNRMTELSRPEPFQLAFAVDQEEKYNSLKKRLDQISEQVLPSLLAHSGQEAHNA